MRDENVSGECFKHVGVATVLSDVSYVCGRALIFSSSDTLKYLAGFLSAVVGFETCTHLQHTAPRFFVSSEGLDAESSAR